MPIMDGAWLILPMPPPPLPTLPPPIMELDGTSIVDDVCDMFDGPRLPYGLGDGAYAL